MKKFARTLVLSVSTAAVMLSALPTAEAVEPVRHIHIVRDLDRVGELADAGIADLTIGAAVLATLRDEAADRTDPERNPYRRPRPSPDRSFFSELRAIHPAGTGYGPAWIDPYVPPFRIITLDPHRR